MTSRELSVFWRIENFSLWKYHISAKSAPFDLQCGEEARNARKFQIVFTPFHATFLPGSLKLRPHKDKASTHLRQKQLPPLRVSLFVTLSTGERKIIHDKGRILNGLEVKRCKVWFKNLTVLLENRAKYLPNDSLTFLVQFTCDEPVFRVKRLFARTRIPIRTYDFKWGRDLSQGRSWSSEISFLPLDIIMITDVSHRNVCEIIMERRFLFTCTVKCDVFLKTDSGEKVLVLKFGVVADKPVRFALSKKFCEQHAKLAVTHRGFLTFYFVCSVDDGEQIAEDFEETPFECGDDNNGTQSGDSRPPPKTQQSPAARKEPEDRCEKNDVGDRAEASRDCSTNVTNTFEEELWIAHLYSQQKFSDFTLKVGARSFPVHRAVLSARSAVLRAIFEADMSENCSEVTDVDADTMDRMLRFVYSGDFEESDVEGAAKLFAAAVKYQIESLKSRCIDCMVASLSAKNDSGVVKEEDEAYLKNLYFQQTFSDFTLKVGDRSFPVHRAVLSLHSAVFRDMFDADLGENCSEVTDVDADTMERMLRFFYHYDLEEAVVEDAAKLFAAADKYQTERLKLRCVDSLVGSLCVGNVCCVLSLADTHGDRTLTAKAKEFIFRNADAVFRGEGWRRLMAENAELASSIMHEIYLG